MPESIGGEKHHHLRLIREGYTGERRGKSAPPGSPPDRKGREDFAKRLLTTTQRIVTDQQGKKPPVPGIKPHLVFRVPIAPTPNPNAVYDLLTEIGLTIVNFESARAVVAFHDEVELKEFDEAVSRYRKGPRINRKTGERYKSTKYDNLEFIEPEQITLWGRFDRVGRSLAEVIGREAEDIAAEDLYTVDVELWHPGTKRAANSGLDEIRSLVNDGLEEGERFLDYFVGDAVLLAKISVKGKKLSRLLDMDIVAEAELPPKPAFDRSEVSSVKADEFPAPPKPPADGPKVCVIDTGIISNHPLLRSNVGHEEAIFTHVSSPADTNGHGTRVAGLAVFGDVRACYAKRFFSSPITLFSARVLNDRNEFDDERLIVNQMGEAIRVFKSAPYNCRVFNISIGSKLPALEGNKPKQTIWAEALDNLAREREVIIVVSSGNHRLASAENAKEAESVLNGYPGFLFKPDASINDPATAAIPITVGGIAQYDTPTKRKGGGTEDIIRPIAYANEPSPFTRTGPGLNGAIKPEFVDYSGNLVFEGFGNYRRIGPDAGTSVMSLSKDFFSNLFDFDIGTSYAAPRVARLAAIISDNLKKELNRAPHPNLVRALLANSALVPPEAYNKLEAADSEQAVIKVCGYGLCSEENALYSFDNAVTLFAEGEIPLDRFHIYSIPIPDSFRSARGLRGISVSLAYDPPVRRRRYDYLGVLMNFDVIRGKSLDYVYRAFRKIEPGVPSESAINSPYRLDLKPRTTSRSGYSRKKSTLQRADFVMRQKDQKNYGDEYWLVIRSERKWAPAGIESQKYAVVVKLTCNAPDLYNEVRMALRAKERERARIRR